MADFTMTEEQYQRLIDGVTSARMEVAEVKGVVSSFAQSLTKEQLAREELARQVAQHDQILRGDGYRQSGLSDQIGDLKDKLAAAQADYMNRANANAASIASLRKVLWTVGAAVSTPIVIDLVLRLIQIAYRSGTP